MFQFHWVFLWILYPQIFPYILSSGVSELMKLRHDADFVDYSRWFSLGECICPISFTASWKRNQMESKSEKLSKAGVSSDYYKSESVSKFLSSSCRKTLKCGLFIWFLWPFDKTWQHLASLGKVYPVHILWNNRKGYILPRNTKVSPESASICQLWSRILRS